MQDKDTNSQTNSDPSATANAAVAQAAQGDFIKKIVEKIKNSENLLIVLSRTPSIDEITAALGLTLFLDGIQKHTTAVYSGRIPDNLAFLQPSETFETNTDSLQDFIISLNKDKADHLRYKLEGDFVKVFITPYKSTISEEDLTFAYGDYNVDFVIAMNVASSGNLDYALREHSRIMRDASVVNITTNDPGHFGEIEWSNPTASSLCEMITDLIFAIQDSDEKPLEHDIATTLLAGIVAATDRFSNNRTNPDTLGVASKLMSMGADQQLITSNINGNEIIHNEENYGYGAKPNPESPTDQRSNLTIDHADDDLTSPNPYAGTNPFTNNPAAQVAPTLNMDANPAPTAMINDTNNVTPESVIVQPIIPGIPTANPGTPTATPATTPATAPTAANSGTPTASPSASSTPLADPGQMQIPNTPVTAPSTPTAPTDPSQMQIPSTPVMAPSANDAPEPITSRNLMTEAPTAPATKQVGNSITPPAPTPKQTKNYAEMMEAALSEDTSSPAAPAPQTTIATPAQPSTPNTAPATPMEPVANPAANAPILPPPPAPAADANGMMPPTLPPVQMPPQA